MDIVNLSHMTSRVVRWSIMRDTKFGVQLKKLLVQCQRVWLKESMPSQTMNVMIRCERLVANDSCRSGVRKIFNHEIMQEIE